MGSRVQLYADIRHDARVDGLSIRQLAAKHGVHRRTVRQALAAAELPPRKTPVRSAPRLDPYKSAIHAMLLYDLTAPRKQRHTATRILARLRDEHDATDLSYSTVRDYVRVRRAQIQLEAGRRVEAMVPQDHAPGAEAEVDFGEVDVILDGVKTKCHMFVYRLSHSGKAIHRVYPTGGQEAVLEGRAAGAFTPAHDVFWAAARKTSGDVAGTQALIDVLLLHGSLPTDAVIAGITSALSVGATSPDVVAAEARRHAASHTPATPATGRVGTVVNLPPRRPADPHQVIAQLPEDTRPLPTVTAYDELLRRRHADSAPARAEVHHHTSTGTP